MRVRILLVEDEPELGGALAARLSSEGFVVDHFASLASAVQAVLGADYRAVLLDRRLPDGDGLSLLPILRTRLAPPPVIVLSALDDIPDRVAGLDAGAEDYLVKPFAFEELVARLRVMLRRSGSSDAAPSVCVGEVEYDLASRETKVSGKALQLPRRELAIMDALVRRAGRVVMREHLQDQVYGYEDDINSNALEAHISRLRRRLSDADAGVLLHGVRGVGYMLKAL